MTFKVFLLGLLVISTLTSLVTEAVKKVMVEHNQTYHSNTLAGVVSVVLSVAVGVAYMLFNGIAFNVSSIVFIFMTMFMSWLCAMVGYDKVMQAISQFKMVGKDDVQ